MTTSPPMAFLADAMLGRLARWLRILGYDTAYEGVLPDEVMIERALRENRWLLTRDGYLAKRRVLRGRHTLLTSDHVRDQLRQLRAELNLDLAVDAETASRCAGCNLLLEPIPHAEAACRVPPFVAQEHTEFAKCPACTRIYWPGTQWTHLLRQLEQLRAP